MSEENDKANECGSPNPWKWATIGLGGLVAVALLGSVVTASFDKGDAGVAGSDTTAATAAANAGDAVATPEPKVAAAKPAPVRVAAAPPAPAPVAPAVPQPTSHDITVCNAYAEQARTQAGDVVKSGVIGGALGAGVGAASGAIINGGKGAGKGAGVGAVVGATAGTVYGLNKRTQDDARAEQAYRQCMAQRGF
jgi:hypothetical protein